MIDLNIIIDELDDKLDDPSKGLPEDIFLFFSRNTPIVNVDLLILNNKGEKLLTWRGGDYYSPGWHIPGGIVRYKESLYDRVVQVAKTELGADVDFKLEPIMINEVIRAQDRKNRGHFISFLFSCTLISDPIRKKGYGEHAWFKMCPGNIIPVHLMYKNILDDTDFDLISKSDFGTSRVIFPII